MMVTIIDIFINTFKQLLAMASVYQGELFSTGCTLWGWTPPQFQNAVITP
jgi:hypothetical protein